MPAWDPEIESQWKEQHKKGEVKHGHRKRPDYLAISSAVPIGHT